MSPLEVKLKLTQAGAILAAAVVSNLPDDNTVDPEITGERTKAENWMGYRLTHIFASGLAAALDPTNASRWEWPKWIEELKAADPVMGKLDGLLGGVTPELIAQLIGKVIPTSATPTMPQAPIPPLPGGK